METDRNTRLRLARLMNRAANRVMRGWTQNAAARDRSSRLTLPSSKSACRWCVVGAIECEIEDLHTYTETLKYIEDRLGISCLPTWNDAKGQSKKEVALTLDLLAEVLRTEKR